MSAWQPRSPLLTAPPPAPPGRDRRTVRRRRWGVAVTSVVAGVLYAALETRWLPTWLGYPLYWAYDEIYLLFKGYLYTWGYPATVPLWGTVALLLLAALVGYLYLWIRPLTWIRPLSPARHVRAARRVLRFEKLRRDVRRWCRFFKGIRQRAQERAERLRKRPRLRRLCQSFAGASLLEEVIEHERRIALKALDTLAPEDSETLEALEKAVTFSLLAAQVLADEPRGEDDLFRAIAKLDEVLLFSELTHVVGAHWPESLHSSRSQLHEGVTSLLQPQLPSQFASAGFSLPGTFCELASVLGVPAPEDWPDPDERWRLVVENVVARRRVLDEARHQLERWSVFGRLHRAPPPGLSKLPRDPLAVRLALDVALLVALKVRAPELALAFVESLEGLRLLLRWTLSELPEAARPLDAVAGLPRTLDYRICGELLAQQQLLPTRDLESALRRQSKVFDPQDRELSEARSAALFAAAATENLRSRVE